MFDLWLTKVSRCPRVRELEALGLQHLRRVKGEAKEANETKWLRDAAAWGTKEAHGRRPAAATRRWSTSNVVLLRDGSVMLSALLVPGHAGSRPPTPMALNAHTATREVLLRARASTRASCSTTTSSAAGSRSSSTASFDRSAGRAHRCALAGEARPAARSSSTTSSSRSCAARRAARPAWRGARRQSLMNARRSDSDRPDPAGHARATRRRRGDALASARRLWRAAARRLPRRVRLAATEVLEFLSALYNGEMRPVRQPADETDIGQHAALSPGQLRARRAGAARRRRARLRRAAVSLKDYPDATAPGPDSTRCCACRTRWS